jgi:hypothetical protein
MTSLHARVNPLRSSWPVAVLLLALSALAGGCAKKLVAAAPAPVPLVVPSVPPRIVGPVVVPEQRPQPVAEAPATPAQPPPVRPPRTPSRPADTAEPVEDPQRARAEGAEATPPPTAPPLLRIRETANDAEATRKVRDVLQRTEQNLAKVNYRTLTTNARSQADTARRLLAQAGEALEKRQLTFALSLAEKAESLSTALVNR